MGLRNAEGRYGALAKLLHWTVALLVVAQVSLALTMKGLPLGQAKFLAVNWHKSLGLLVLLLMVARLLWRRLDPPPPLPPMPAWERLAAKSSHFLLYLLLFALPLLGLLRAFTSGFPTEIFGLFRLPSPLPTHEGASDLFSLLHSLLAWALVGLVGLHVGAALKHHFLHKDDVLRRMLPLLLFVLFLAVPVQPLSAAEAPRWTVEEGRILFEVTQSGEPVEGSFETWRAEIRFDPAAPESGRLLVEVETASLATGNRERDRTATGDGLLEAEGFPLGRFEAEGFREVGEGRYEAPGRLTLRDVTREVVLPFHLEFSGEDRSEAKAEGKLVLDRLDYGIGQGDWASTIIVGPEVALSFSLLARRAD